MSLHNLSNPKFAPYFTAMDCVLSGEEAVYGELTSGPRAFNEMRKHGVKASTERRRNPVPNGFRRISSIQKPS